MKTFALIGGSGLDKFELFDDFEQIRVQTPYDESPVDITKGTVQGLEVAFLSRHGVQVKRPPHMINFRANIWALSTFEPDSIIALASVGCIDSEHRPGMIAIPDQILDYTSGRETSYNTGLEESINFIDFTYPFDMNLKETIVKSGDEMDMDFIDGGVYACTQGPRLETAAEIDRLGRDGAHYVGMTLMPEACLAKELNLPYAAICQLVNFAAGRGDSKERVALEETQATLKETTEASVKLALQTFKNRLASKVVA